MIVRYGNTSTTTSARFEVQQRDLLDGERIRGGLKGRFHGVAERHVAVAVMPEQVFLNLARVEPPVSARRLRSPITDTLPSGVTSTGSRAVSSGQ
ncbi:hypothetical protein R5W24_006278 [Gemmata sp. JC717]|uniref:hypothetical protein n=1 Tax=Gemmata algarum TaxID=2975278 RepID=UPI0021BA5626|nr:hypothetical protein [Gemmata algarum]MDY3557091.1 hypothetical protein [Gemmata algarum]